MSTNNKLAGLDNVTFYKNYTIVMLTVFITILLSLSLLFVHRLKEEYSYEIDIIETYVDRNGQSVEYLLRSSLDQLEIIRMDAELKASNRKACDPLSSSISQEFKQTAQGFSLDQIIDRDSGGNLIGIGSLKNRSQEFYCDLQTGLRLRDNFRSLPFTLPGVSNAYFVSTHQFFVESPWHLSDESVAKKMIYELLDRNKGLDQEKINRLPYWSDVYHFDGANTGLVIPISAALFSDQRYIGILSFGLSLDFINRINKDLSYPQGTTLIYTENGTVVAHPDFYANPHNIKAAPLLAETLSKSLGKHIHAIESLPSGKPGVINNQIVIRYQLNAIPWSLLFVIPQSTVMNKIVHDFGPGMLGVLVGLALLMMSSYFFTSRYFIKPAAKLVEHVSQESNFNPQPIPNVPKNWRPWFEVITRAFHESLKLNTLQREIDIAAQLQANLLPRHWPQDTRYELWGKMTPAKEVGGDFYDHLQIDNGETALVVADVSGKGISAGLFSMVSKTYLRSLAMYGLLPANEVVSRVNNRLCEENETCMFVTTFYGQYNPDTGQLSMSNAGHPPQLLISAKGDVSWITPSKNSPALGILENAPYYQSTLQLQPGDQLLIFTDGVNEAMSHSNEEFGLDKIAELFKDNPSNSAQESVERVFLAVAEHEKGTEQSDDITCMALYRMK